MEEVKGTGTTIENLGMFNLIDMKPDDLTAVTRIQNVGVIIAPEELIGTLMKIPQSNVGLTVTIPPISGKIKQLTGQLTVDGEAFANRSGSPEDTLVISGFKPNRATFSPVLSVPAPESAYLESMALGWNGNRKHFNKYRKVFLKKYNKITKPGDMIHRLLGHPEQIQGDMQVACEAMTTGLTYDMLKDPEVYERAVKSALKWRLLLQIDSEEKKTGIMFGDEAL